MIVTGAPKLREPASTRRDGTQRLTCSSSIENGSHEKTLLDRVEAIEGIQRGLADVKAGRTKPARQVFARLRRKHGIPRGDCAARGGRPRGAVPVGGRAGAAAGRQMVQ